MTYSWGQRFRSLSWDSNSRRDVFCRESHTVIMGSLKLRPEVGRPQYLDEENASRNYQRGQRLEINKWEHLKCNCDILFLSFRRSHNRSMGGRVQQWAPGQVGVVPYRSVEWFNPNSLPRPVSRFGKIRGKSSRAQRACDIYKSISGPGYISATAMRLGSGSLRCTAMKIIQRERERTCNGQSYRLISRTSREFANACK